MATSGSTSVTVTAYDTLKFSWWKNSSSTSGNYTDIGWKMELIAVNYGLISSSAKKNWAVTINGTNYSGTNSIAIGNNQTKTLASGTTRIYHNADGTKSFNYSFSQQFDMNFNGWVGTKSGSGSATLDSIPRYASITIFDLSSGLETITGTWGADSACDLCQYSLNNGAWVSVGYPNFTIAGLYPNTTYNVKIRVKRADSQLWTESATKSITTKNISSVSSASSINFGDTARIVVNNPSGATKRLRIETLNPTTTIATRDNISNDVTVTFSDAEWDNFYKKLGNNNSITIRYVIDTFGANTYYCSWVDRTLTLRGNQKTIKRNVSGTWKRGKVWINVSGTWKRAVIWVKINGTWRRSI